MSALARYFHRRGDKVSGYDRTPSPLTAELEAEGIEIHYDDRPDNLPESIDLVIYTPAVPKSLGEYQELERRGIEMKKRSQVLGELTKGKRCIAVAGSHGKTTTSTLIAHLLSKSACGCSAFLGGISKNFGSNVYVDHKSEYIVVEADEYDRSFLQLHPHYAVITATDADHLDIYGDHHTLLEAYAEFAASVRSILLVEIDKKDKKRYVRAIKSNFDESDNTPVELVFDKNRRLSFQEKESDDIVEEHDFTQIEHASIILNTLLSNGPHKVSDIKQILNEEGISAKTAPLSRFSAK